MPWFVLFTVVSFSCAGVPRASDIEIDFRSKDACVAAAEALNRDGKAMVTKDGRVLNVKCLKKELPR